MAKPERFETLQKAFQTMEGGAALMGKSFSAQTATLKDSVKDIIRNVTEPVFMVWTDQLAAANEWMTKNKDSMREMAENYGPKLAALWESAARNPGAVTSPVGSGLCRSILRRSMIQDPSSCCRAPSGHCE